MKIKLFICLFMFLLTFFTIFSETINISTANYEPYTKFVEKKAGGVFIEIVDTAFSKVGITPVYINEPWKRGYYNTTANLVDATLPYAKTPERETECLYSEGIINSKNKFFIKRGKKIFSKLLMEKN